MSDPENKPCPFCFGTDLDINEDEGGDVSVYCEECQAEGPATRVGCRDDEEDIDLESEAWELWNNRNPNGDGE